MNNCAKPTFAFCIDPAVWSSSSKITFSTTCWKNILKSCHRKGHPARQQQSVLQKLWPSTKHSLSSLSPTPRTPSILPTCSPINTSSSPLSHLRGTNIPCPWLGKWWDQLDDCHSLRLLVVALVLQRHGRVYPQLPCLFSRRKTNLKEGAYQALETIHKPRQWSILDCWCQSQV